jgi:diguanylate cyclase (GGDEF)-like protein
MDDAYLPTETAAPHDAGASPRRASVSVRIRLAVFLSTFLTAALVSAITLDAIHRHLRNRVEAHFPSLLERRGRALEDYIAETRTALAADLARATRDGFAAEEASAAGRLVAALLSRHPDLDALAVVLEDDRVIAHTGTITGALAAEAARATRDVAAGGAIPLSVLEDANEARLATTVRASGDGTGRLIAVFGSPRIQALLRLDADEGPGRLLVTDALRPALARSRTGAGADDDAAPTLRVEPYAGADGAWMLGSARPLGDGPVHLLVEAPARVVYAPLVTVMTRVVICDALIVLVFSLLAMRITRAILQPIEALSESAARIARGDLDHEIPEPRTHDELGLLTRSFNEMMRRLRLSQEEIEQDKLQLTEQNEELQRANEILAQLSITDGLTKLHNHRFFQDHLTREIKRVERTREPLSMLLLDLDDFKRLNDRHGHAAGDEVLMNIAGQLNENVRESDLLARYGGEEFVILTPNTDLGGAIALAEKIRMSIESMPQIVDDSMRPIRVTISCGVAQYEGDRRRFFQAADRALYQAKADGKNCVVSALDLA